MFDYSAKKVLLIKKRRPPFQEGLYNGIGGCVEEGERPEITMVREFEEKTGIWCTSWEWAATILPECGIITCYTAVGNIDKARTMTDEIVSSWYVDKLPPGRVDSLSWLVPLAKDRLSSNKAYTIYESLADSNCDE